MATPRTVFASCGHSLAPDEGPDGFGFPGTILDYDFSESGRHKTATTGQYCRSCHEWHASRGHFATPAELEAWFSPAAR